MAILKGWVSIDGQFESPEGELVADYSETDKLLEELVAKFRKHISVVEHRVLETHHLVFLGSFEKRAGPEYYNIDEPLAFIKKRLFWADLRIELTDWETDELTVFEHRYTE